MCHMRSWALSCATNWKNLKRLLYFVVNFARGPVPVLWRDDSSSTVGDRGLIPHKGSLIEAVDLWGIERCATSCLFSSVFSLSGTWRVLRAKSVVGLLEIMKTGRGIKGLEDKSRGMEILMTEAFAKINPTDPLILGKQAARRKRKWPDSSGISLPRAAAYAT